MKFRSCRLLNKQCAGPICRIMRTARLSVKPKRDDRVERFVNRRANLVAAPVPKVASRTVKQIFVGMGEMSRDIEEHLHPDEIRATYPSAFVFSFVRNPWARVYSCWKDKIDDAVTPGKLSIISRFHHLYPFMPFEEFVEWLETEDGSDAHADRHWLSQTAHLSSSLGHGFCDFIGRIETFEDGLREIQCRTGATLRSTGALNVQNRSESYVQVFSPRAKRIIEQRYGNDIETFGYQFN